MMVASRRNNFYETIYVQIGFAVTCSWTNKFFVITLGDFNLNPTCRICLTKLTLLRLETRCVNFSDVVRIGDVLLDCAIAKLYICMYVQGDQKFSVHTIIVQKTRQNILNSFIDLPW
jgi:hypothetical protein